MEGLRSTGLHRLVVSAVHNKPSPPFFLIVRGKKRGSEEVWSWSHIQWFIFTPSLRKSWRFKVGSCQKAPIPRNTRKKLRQNIESDLLQSKKNPEWSFCYCYWCKKSLLSAVFPPDWKSNYTFLCFWFVFSNTHTEKVARSGTVMSALKVSINNMKIISTESAPRSIQPIVWDFPPCILTMRIEVSFHPLYKFVFP